jgi:hypothetical protein
LRRTAPARKSRLFASARGKTFSSTSSFAGHGRGKIDRLIADKQALAADVLADGGEIPLAKMRDDELLKIASLSL